MFVFTRTYIQFSSQEDHNTQIQEKAQLGLIEAMYIQGHGMVQAEMAHAGKTAVTMHHLS